MTSRIATEELVLSIDGGGTKTDVCIARAETGQAAEVIGRATGGPANLTSSGVERVIDVLEKVIDEACEDAGVSSGQFDRAVIALAGGADRAGCRQIERWMNGRSCEKVRVISDADLILSVAEALAPAGSAAIGLLVGTGSIAYFRMPNELDTRRVGGWGSVLGDDGSGYWIGRAALRRVLQEADDEVAPGLLAKGLFQELGAKTARGLIAKVHQENTTATIAGLTPVVFAAAEAGDDAAREILMEAAIHIGLLVAQVVGRVDSSPEGIVVAAAGSVVTRPSPFRVRVEELIRVGGIKEIHFVDDPVVAAIQLALDK